MKEESPSYTIAYIYDSKGSPSGFMYRMVGYSENVWDTYFFEKNMFGDIVAVYDASGTKLVSYRYNAWGMCVATYHNGGGSTGAKNNPFRYRGYYYDSDLGMYYLQSRYYDPVVGRFINADSYLVNSLLGYNLFAYCENNPVNKVDPTGHFADYVDFDDNQDCLDDPDKFAGGGGGSSSSGTSNGTNGSHISNSFTGNANSGSSNSLPQNGITVDSSTGLELAINYLGKGYKEVSPDRFISSDGVRQVRISNADILGLHGGGPHINFDLLSPKYKTVHVYIRL